MAAERETKRASARPKRRGRPGRIGNDIFAMVQRLVAEQKTTRTGAFKRIADKTGRNEGTVAANYYRVARQRGVKLKVRRRRGTAAPASTRRTIKSRPGLGRAMSTMRELTALLRQQASEITRLQRENQRFLEIRRLLAR